MKNCVCSGMIFRIMWRWQGLHWCDPGLWGWSAGGGSQGGSHIVQSKGPAEEEQTRTLKSLNFPVGRLWSAKSFQTKCINFVPRHVCQKCVCKSFSRHIQKCVDCSRQSENCPKVLSRLSMKLFRPSVKFSDCPEKKLFQLSGNFSDCLETFSTGNFPENFQTVRKISRLSGNIFKCLEAFQTVWKVSRLSWNLFNCANNFQMTTA